MGFLTSWLFWVILSLIVFLLAILGYLTESKKKNEKETLENNAASPAPVAPAPQASESDAAVTSVSNEPAPLEEGAVLNLDNGTWGGSEPASQPAAEDDWSVMPTVSDKVEQTTATTEAPESDLSNESVIEEQPTVVQPATEAVSNEAQAVVESQNQSVAANSQENDIANIWK